MGKLADELQDVVGSVRILEHKLAKAEAQRDTLLQFCQDFVSISKLPATKVWADGVEYPLVDALVGLLDRAEKMVGNVKGEE